MAIAVDDHPELRAPITQMIVRSDLVAKKTQGAAERVADHRRANMSDVHGLGDVGRGIVDHKRTGMIGGGDAESVVMANRFQLF